ncbi:MAG: hypothetical protein LBI05_05695 [Planctomycetaceae bacterium]|jgi:hypothetical protein|nr:hypothetical protein [Planctomycetaceae bacterium]
MKTIAIDEQMEQVGERAGHEEYEKFVQMGIAQWHKERAERKDKETEKPAESNNR